MVDFIEITKHSNLYNFHSHTPYCDGHAPMRDFVVEAAAQGFTDYGFSPHSPIPFDSPCNIKMEDINKYSRDYDEVKAEFAGQINLYKSMEIDYLDDEWNARNPIYDAMDLDYKLSSVHFIPCGDIFVDTDGSFENFKVKMSNHFDNDIVTVVKTFYAQTLKMIEKGGFEIIGHFDKIGCNAGYFAPGIESEDWYRALVIKVIEAIRDTNLIAEINTKALFVHNRLFPNERYFCLLKKYNIPIIFNSDAHYPDKINAGRMEAIDKYNRI